MNNLSKVFKISISICILIFSIISVFPFTGCEQIEKLRKGFEERIDKEKEKEITLESTKIEEKYKSEYEQILNLCLSEEPKTIDPNLAKSKASIDLINQIFVGLTKFESDLSVSPCIAENWKISDDGIVYTFKIRDDAYWTNGDNVTANDFVYSWKRLLAPETNSPFAYLFFDIKGAKEFHKGELDFDAVGIKAKNDYELEVKLRGPINYFTYITSIWITKPVPKSVVEKYKENWTDINYLITNGPFTIKNWEHNEKILLEKNSNYFEGAPKLNTINIFFCNDQYIEFSMYKNDKVDGTWGWESGISSDLLKKIDSDPLLKSQKLFEPGLSVYYLGFNVRNKPINNPLLRKAIALALDKNELKNNPYWKTFTIANKFIPPQILEYDESMDINFDLEKAKGLLFEALQQNEESSNEMGVRTLKLIFSKSDKNRILAESIKNMLSENLNLKIELIETDIESYFEKIHNINKYPQVTDMYLLEKRADYPHPNNYLFTKLHSKSPLNYSGWKNDEFDELVTNAMIYDDLNKQAELYKKASKIAFGDKSDEDRYPGEFPIIPLFYSSRNILVKPWVKGYWSNPFTGPYFYATYIEK
jgi:ABC-type oligopeptide transport system substrate-binding subunit